MLMSSYRVRISTPLRLLRGVACVALGLVATFSSAWSTDPAVGVTLSQTASDSSEFQAVDDGTGGKIFVWQSFSNGSYDLHAQRVNSAGTVLWGPDGVPVCTAARGQIQPQPVSDGLGGVIITWADSRSGLDNDIYAQRLSPEGLPLWQVNGLVVNQSPAHQWYPQAVSDGAGGTIISWQDNRAYPTESPIERIYQIYAQRISGSGALQWPFEGVLVSGTSEISERRMKAAPDNQNGILVTWVNMQNDLPYKLYAQRLSREGLPLWAPDGVPVTSGAPGHATICSDDGGGAFVLWEKPFADGNLYVQRLNSSGARTLGDMGELVCAADIEAERSMIEPDGLGGAVMVWEGRRVYSSHVVYAQRLTFSGTFAWAQNGLAVSAPSGIVNFPSLAGDGGGAYITWYSRGDEQYHIRAQHLSSAGAFLWSPAGVIAATTLGTSYPFFTPAVGGGAIIAWDDGLLVKANRISGAGVLGGSEKSGAALWELFE